MLLFVAAAVGYGGGGRWVGGCWGWWRREVGRRLLGMVGGGGDGVGKKMKGGWGIC